MKYMLFAAAALTLAVPAQAQVVGISSAVQNDVRLKKPGAPLPRPVALRQRISLAEQIQTGAKSQLQMLLLDKSTFTVGPNARVTIDRYVYDPARGSRSMGATVTRGAFRFMSGRRTNGGTSTITTRTGVIGVRGTVLDGVAGEDAALIAAGEAGARGVRGDPETATLVVLRGPGRATQGNVTPGAIDVTAGGRTVTVDRPMQAVYIPYEGAAPIGPFPISNRGLMQLQAVLFPALAQRLGLQPPVDPNQSFAPRSDIWPPPGTTQNPGPRPFGRPPGGFDPNGPGGQGPPGGFAPQLPNLPNLPTIPRGRDPVQRPQVQAPAPVNQRSAVVDQQPAAPNDPAPKDSIAPPANPPPANLKAAPPPVDQADPTPPPPDPKANQPTGKPNQPDNNGKGKDPPPPPPR